jgi:hypothetical protein
VLLVRVRITNPHSREIPMYWWSNAAVPETPDTRVLVPADHAYRFGYGRRLSRVPLPMLEGKDASYPTRLERAMDFFYRIPDGHRPWIAALDGTGRGLVQTSTDLLKGRKLFVWGMGPGGRRWQEFLSRPGHAYIETQAGLARTQSEHLPMPAGTKWSWLEAYGLMEADATIVHGQDWGRARGGVEQRLERLVSRHALEAEWQRGKEMADRHPIEILHRGSGWGALERIRRGRTGERPFCSEALLFGDDSLGEDQSPWLALLRDGALPSREPEAGPGAYMVQSEWRDRLEAAVRQGRGAHWLAWLHLGVMRHYAAERDAARLAWETSHSLCLTPWALRNLAVLAREEKQPGGAADLLASACRLQPGLLPLAVECGRALVDAGRHREWLALLTELPETVRTASRIVLLEGRAALAAGELDRVERILTRATEVVDLREGEASLTDLWFGLYEKRLSVAEGVPIDDALRARVRREFPPPAALDFRMS